jgi:hypothetical protein
VDASLRRPGRFEWEAPMPPPSEAERRRTLWKWVEEAAGEGTRGDKGKWRGVAAARAGAASGEQAGGEEGRVDVLEGGAGGGGIGQRGGAAFPLPAELVGGPISAPQMRTSGREPVSLDAEMQSLAVEMAAAAISGGEAEESAISGTEMNASSRAEIEKMSETEDDSAAENGAISRAAMGSISKAEIDCLASELALGTNGYSTADLLALKRKAVGAAAARLKPGGRSGRQGEHMARGDGGERERGRGGGGGGGGVQAGAPPPPPTATATPALPSSRPPPPDPPPIPRSLLPCDWRAGLSLSVASSLRHQATGGREVERLSMDTIGGLASVKERLYRAVAWPLEHPQVRG